MFGSGKGIVWGRVVAIAAVQSAITLMWIAYRAYLGKMLGAWGFTEAFTANLLTIEVVLAVVMEPLFGAMGDRQQRKFGSFAPLITLGVILSSAIFVGLPLIAALNLPMRGLLPFVAIAWALAMTTFRAPIYVLLLKSAPRVELPLAISILTMAAGIMTILKPNIQTFLLGLGAIPAFLIGSITLLGASTFLRFFMPPLQPPAEDQWSATPHLPILGLLKTLFMAIALAWGSTILLGNVSKIFAESMTLLNVLLALAAVPVGWLAIRWQKSPLLAIALGSLTVILALFLVAPYGGIAIALYWVMAVSAMKNGTIPYIFEVVSTSWAGLGIGLFFGVTGLANTLFPNIFSGVNPTLQGIFGLGLLAIATLLALLPFLKEKTEALSDEVE